MWGEDEQQKSLKERFSQMSDDELLKIVCEDYEDYHETALQFAEQELNSRGIFLEDEKAGRTAATPFANDEADAEIGATCTVCGGKMRVGNLFAGKEVTILFTEESEQRFVDVLACEKCGQIKMVVDYETDVES